ncbi:thermonuclease family protein [Comamonas endophytica]|uniref:Thermonuclease family protein n=1 Tax=Comamonas endophytica TaxID=2949090 RepID=A0ABY6GAB7_9BURK|nr:MULTISPECIES: thermonuclease family protein [unclassified Acidovorax]MCD2512096.1 thermonuclease family protein [Acidovorax sp. D4N7]UYG51873.1 thermonuclease family protein [Acidovorax sp. 5MLIR]
MLATLLVCLVIGISDGDSLTVQCGPTGHAQLRQVRIHGIDAPERFQSFSEASRDSLAALCLHAHARIRPLEIDGYGRLVARLECREEDVAAHQVRNGMAWAYLRYARSRSDLAVLEAHARRARVGLWADPHPVAPWDWRHR